MDKRTLLAVVLSIIVLLIYQNFFVKPPVKTEPAPQQQTAVAPQAAKPSPESTAATAAAPAAPAQPTAAAHRTPPQVSTGTERDVVVETPLFRALLTTRGGTLKSLQLKQYKTELEDSEDVVDKFLRLIGQGKPKRTGGPKPVELVHVDRKSVV